MGSDTLSLRGALPILLVGVVAGLDGRENGAVRRGAADAVLFERLHQRRFGVRSEEHTSELQSPCNIVCRLLLEKKNAKMSYARQRMRNADGATLEDYT